MVAAFVLGLAAIAAVFGQVVVALPIAVIGVLVVGALDFRRRRKSSQQLKDFPDQAEAEKVDFTARDKETLASSE
jgi:Flp pilus assembly protein TadB